MYIMVLSGYDRIDSFGNNPKIVIVLYFCIWNNLYQHKMLPNV
jgi:hypothetical protein